MASYPYIKKIHTMKNILKIDEESYREMLSGYGHKSSKDLSDKNAIDLITKLDAMAGERGVGVVDNRKKYNDLAGRPGDYASPKQLRMIEGMWMNHRNVEHKNETAMNSFIKRVTGIDNIRWIRKSHVSMIVKALENL